MLDRWVAPKILAGGRGRHKLLGTYIAGCFRAVSPRLDGRK